MEKRWLFYLVIIILALLLIITNIGEIAQITGFATSSNLYNICPENSSLQNFSTYTKAVCENRSDGVNCHDELFVKCGSIEQIVQLPNGATNFPPGWQDPRNRQDR